MSRARLCPNCGWALGETLDGEPCPDCLVAESCHACRWPDHDVEDDDGVHPCAVAAADRLELLGWWLAGIVAVVALVVVVACWR